MQYPRGSNISSRRYGGGPVLLLLTAAALLSVACLVWVVHVRQSTRLDRIERMLSAVDALAVRIDARTKWAEGLAEANSRIICPGEEGCHEQRVGSRAEKDARRSTDNYNSITKAMDDNGRQRTAGQLNPLCVATEAVGQRQIKSFPPKDSVLQVFSEEHGGTVRRGGKWTPTHCTARTKVALVVPLRSRPIQLRIFLAYMHPFLQKQSLDYQIFVIEQGGTSPFNRGSLSNIGFKEAMKTDEFDCVIFSDVDLIPEDYRNMYDCRDSPKHMSVAIDKFNYRLPYTNIFGGVGAFKPADFLRINGYSNLYWGWGCEDDDLFSRCEAEKMKPKRPSVKIAKYTMIQLDHRRSDGQNKKSWKILDRAKERYKKEGLSTLVYKVINRTEAALATEVVIDISPDDHEYYTLPTRHDRTQDS